MRLAILAALLFSTTAFSHAADSKRALTPAERSAVIEKVRAYALNYAKGLPNFTCTQQTQQTLLRSSPGTMLQAARNIVEEQVSFVANREIRRVVSINGKPVAADGPDQQHGTISRGEFGNLIENIFDPQTAADIRWDRETTLNRRRLYVLAYRVPQPKGYTLTETKRAIQVPYQGSVYVDPETMAVVRLEMKCLEIPKDSEYSGVALTLEYQPAEVAGLTFILPAHFQLNYQMLGGTFLNGAEYTNYRRFSADASIKFDGDKNQ